MEATAYFLRQKLSKFLDFVCILMVGLGLGGLLMYQYAIGHPQNIIQAQPHVLIEPQTQAGKNLSPATSNQLLEI